MRVKVRYVWERIYDTKEDYEGWSKDHMVNDALEDIALSAAQAIVDDLEVKVLAA